MVARAASSLRVRTSTYTRREHKTRTMRRRCNNRQTKRQPSSVVASSFPYIAHKEPRVLRPQVPIENRQLSHHRRTWRRRQRRRSFDTVCACVCVCGARAFSSRAPLPPYTERVRFSSPHRDRSTVRRHRRRRATTTGFRGPDTASSCLLAAAAVVVCPPVFPSYRTADITAQHTYIHSHIVL